MSNRVLFLFALLATACSSSSGSGGSDGGPGSTPCNQDPWECPASQTCWPQNATTFACLNAGPGKLGDSCVDTAGSPTCGAGLACLQGVGGTTAGTCLAYCSTTDPSHACAGSAICQTAIIGGTGGAEFSVCVPQATGGSDGGNEASSQADTGTGIEASAGD
jgi:hypothetical protein